MANFNAHIFKLDDEERLMSKLETNLNSVRNAAHSIVIFLENLTHQSTDLLALTNAYKTIESIPLQSLDDGLETLQSELVKVHFTADKTHKAAMNEDDFVTFLEKQNQFAAEVNKLVSKAIEIESRLS